MAEAFRKGDVHVFNDEEYVVKAVYRVEDHITVEFAQRSHIELPTRMGAVVTDDNNFWIGFVRIRPALFDKDEATWVQLGKGVALYSREVIDLLRGESSVGVRVLFEGVQD